jgi:hypothetical protein
MSIILCNQHGGKQQPAAMSAFKAQPVNSNWGGLLKQGAC